jgi:hypothetical protein
VAMLYSEPDGLETPVPVFTLGSFNSKRFGHDITSVLHLGDAAEDHVTGLPFAPAVENLRRPTGQASMGAAT